MKQNENKLQPIIYSILIAPLNWIPKNTLSERSLTSCSLIDHQQMRVFYFQLNHLLWSPCEKASFTFPLKVNILSASLSTFLTKDYFATTGGGQVLRISAATKREQDWSECELCRKMAFISFRDSILGNNSDAFFRAHELTCSSPSWVTFIGDNRHPCCHKRRCKSALWISAVAPIAVSS